MSVAPAPAAPAASSAATASALVPSVVAAEAIRTIGVVGSGAMGRGIAQIAAVAGATVRLFDANPQALAAARSFLADTLGSLVTKGRMTREAADAAIARVVPVDGAAALADCDLVVEAIVERLDAKQALFAQLETIVRADAILASNTSSLSITAIAAGCRAPHRVAGWHFFNPVPLMKLVEVIAGARTAPAACDALTALSRRLGHTPVTARDTPGFIVNHAGRAFGTEALRLLHENVASIPTIDRILREQAGFRLGPFELMDLTGLDVSHPVMESIYRQYYEEPRYRPSVLAAQRVAAGLLGRKTREGFYDYREGAAAEAAPNPPEPPAPDARPASVWVSRAHARGHAAATALIAALGARLEETAQPSADALIVVTPYGEDATTAAVSQGLDATRTVALDTLLPLQGAKRRTLMVTPVTAAAVREAAHGLFAADGVPVSVIADSAGFVAQRVIAMIVSIGCDIAQQAIASPSDVDLAVKLGLGYPHGPLEFGDHLGPATVLEILGNLQRVTGDPRYRPGPWLARRAMLGVSLHTAG